MEMKRSRTAGGIVVHRVTGHILVVSQRGDSWSLPKGHVDPGEDDLAAARREITEESGVTELELVETLGEYERHPMTKGGAGERLDEMKTIVLFLFTTAQTELAPVDPENPEARWVPRHEVAALLTHAKDSAFFASVLERLP